EGRGVGVRGAVYAPLCPLPLPFQRRQSTTAAATGSRNGPATTTTQISRSVRPCKITVVVPVARSSVCPGFQTVAVGEGVRVGVAMGVGVMLGVGVGVSVGRCGSRLTVMVEKA